MTFPGWILVCLTLATSQLNAELTLDEPATVLDKISVQANLFGFPKELEQKVLTAMGKLEKTLNTQMFKEEVLSYGFSGKTGFYQNQNLSNQKIYELIMSGIEKRSPEHDRTINLNLYMYREESKVVGYTYPNTDKIWVNKKYIEKYTYAEIANNAIHEWLHKAGFDHSYYKTPDRIHSVPYAIGELVEKIINLKIEAAEVDGPLSASNQER